MLAPHEADCLLVGSIFPFALTVNPGHTNIHNPGRSGVVDDGHQHLDIILSLSICCSATITPLRLIKTTADPLESSSP